MSLDATDRRLLAAIEDGLPLADRPYAIVGARLDIPEQEVIARLRAMIEAGIVKRFGLIVRHHELGYRANAMVVWDVTESQVDIAARRISRAPFVTLCYRRPRRPPDWPYNLFCMIHGRDRNTVSCQIEHLRKTCGIIDTPFAVLFSRRRFKQRGAKFSQQVAEVA